jgi:hypothetical protein
VSQDPLSNPTFNLLIAGSKNMPVRFFYVDESYDEKKFCLSAISIRHSVWKECFDKVRQHRVNLKNDHGIYLRKEIHARDFVVGRGKISPQIIGKWQRSRIFHDLLKLVATLPEVMVFNVCLETKNYEDPQLIAWDRLMNRIERTMLAMEDAELPKRRELVASIAGHLTNEATECIEKRLNIYRARAAIFADEGREKEITKALRKMHVYNRIPSQYGAWPSGEITKNITTDRIIEDPVFKSSDRSFFIQLADCVAFALLKREVTPTPNIRKYGIHEMFDQTISGVCFRKASLGDPLGIVRS